MKYLYQFIAVTILTSAIFTSASATTGGPTFVYEFSYNPLDESVYYMKADHGGRGCPPELFKLSLNSKTSTVVYSCDEAEKNPGPVSQKIANITAGFKNLTPVNLAKNNGFADGFARLRLREAKPPLEIFCFSTTDIFPKGRVIK